MLATIASQDFFFIEQSKKNHFAVVFPFQTEQFSLFLVNPSGKSELFFDKGFLMFEMFDQVPEGRFHTFSNRDKPLKEISWLEGVTVSPCAEKEKALELLLTAKKQLESKQPNVFMGCPAGIDPIPAFTKEETWPEIIKVIEQAIASFPN